MDLFTPKKMRVVFASGLEEAAAAMARLLPSLRAQAELLSAAPEELPSLLAEGPADALVLRPEDFDLASELSQRGYTGVLILGGADEIRRIAPACVAAGILTARYEEMEGGLRQLLALCARLRALRQRANILRRQLDDTRLVSRAKLLLMSRFKMSEEDAHRYIEKTAMDTGAKRREVAENIIRTYEG